MTKSINTGRQGSVLANVPMMMVLALGLVIAFILGMHVVRDLRMTLIMVSVLLVVVTVQYHHNLSIIVPIIFFPTAFIFSFLPGRPFVWEVAPIIGVSGLITTFVFHRQQKSLARYQLGTILGLWGIVGFSCVLLFLMYYRGFGFRVLGSDEYGGRYYIQQLVCAFFPIVFLYRTLERDTYTKLLIIGQILTATYLITDLLLQFHQFDILYRVMYVFDFSTDSLNFFRRGLRGQLQRFQSMGTFSFGYLVLMLIWKKPSDMIKTPWALIATAGLLTVGAFSGHRSLVVRQFFLIGAWLFVHKVHRRPMFVFSGVLLSVLLLVGLYATAPRLPGPIQRSVEFLPGLNIDPMVKRDATGTMAMRRELRHIGWGMIPQYLWIGAGFTFPPHDLTAQLDRTGLAVHLQMRTFYNGFVGLMVNTGIPGTFFMFLFLLGGSLNALYLIRRFMARNYDDLFSRAAVLFAGLWPYDVAFFIFFHGDSEFAMKRFAFQFALILVFMHFFLLRDEGEKQALEEAPIQDNGLLTRRGANGFRDVR